jgi:nucleoside-diphosphate-sugar epimerase
MANIAIIGASGNVGYRLVLKLSLYHNVVCIVRNTEKRDFSNVPNAKIVKVNDVSATDELAIAIKGCDGIIDTSSIQFSEHIFNAIQLNTIRPKHIIFTSSAGIYSKLSPGSVGRRKKGEQFIFDNYDFPWTIIRPTMIYGHLKDGNISRLIKVVNSNSVLPLIGKGDQLIQPVFIDDLIKAYDTALLNNEFYYKIFDIGGLNALSNKTLLKKIAETLNKRILYIPVNPMIAISLVRILRKYKMSPVSEEQAKRFLEDKSVDNTEFIKMFNIIPRSFEVGLAQLIDEMRRNNCL